MAETAASVSVIFSARTVNDAGQARKTGLSVSCLLLHFLLVGILHGVDDGWVGEMKEVLIELFFRQRFRGVVGVERRHRRRLDHLLATRAETRVVDSGEAMRGAGRGRRMDVQHVVLGVDSPDL